MSAYGGLMSYPEHMLCQFGGTLGDNVQEIWSCGIRMVESGGVGGDEVDPEQWLDDTGVPALSAWMGRADSEISFSVRLRWVKFNRIGPDGRYLETGPTHERLDLNVQGNGGSSTLPFQATTVLTWRTNNANRGRGSKGRIYSPLPSFTIQSDGLFAQGYADTMASSAATLINSLDAGLGAVGGGVIRPHIVSSLGDGVSNQIDYVTVDNRIDIQRRRANSLVAIQSRAEVDY